MPFSVETSSYHKHDRYLDRSAAATFIAIVLVVIELNDWNESYGRHDILLGRHRQDTWFHVDGVWC